MHSTLQIDTSQYVWYSISNDSETTSDLVLKYYWSKFKRYFRYKSIICDCQALSPLTMLSPSTLESCEWAEPTALVSNQYRNPKLLKEKEADVYKYLNMMFITWKCNPKNKDKPVLYNDYHNMLVSSTIYTNYNCLDNIEIYKDYLRHLNELFK